MNKKVLHHQSDRVHEGAGWDGRSSLAGDLSGESVDGERGSSGASGREHRRKDESGKASDASQMKIQFAGIEMAPPLSKEEQERQNQLIEEALRTGDSSKVPPAREPSVAVEKDQSGMLCIQRR